MNTQEREKLIRNFLKEYGAAGWRLCIEQAPLAGEAQTILDKLAKILEA